MAIKNSIIIMLRDISDPALYNGTRIATKNLINLYLIFDFKLHAVPLAKLTIPMPLTFAFSINKPHDNR